MVCNGAGVALGIVCKRGMIGFNVPIVWIKGTVENCGLRCDTSEASLGIVGIGAGVGMLCCHFCVLQLNTQAPMTFTTCNKINTVMQQVVLDVIYSFGFRLW